MQKTTELDKKKLTEEKSDVICDVCGKPMVIKTGRFGKFLACTGYPDCKNTVRLDANGEKQEKIPDEPIGKDPESGKPIFLKIGRFGAYVQLGEKEGKEKPKTSSLLAMMDPKNMTVEIALKLLSLPRELGENKAGEKIIAANGRFGPYVKAGKETRSLPGDMPPTDVTLEQALDLLSKPKAKGRGKTELKNLGKDSESREIKIMSGRFGPYVTDGETNVSVPKDKTPGALTLEDANKLLEAKR